MDVGLYYFVLSNTASSRKSAINLVTDTGGDFITSYSVCLCSTLFFLQLFLIVDAVYKSRKNHNWRKRSANSVEVYNSQLIAFYGTFLLGLDNYDTGC